MKVLRLIIPEPPPSVSKAARNIVKYDPIGAMQSRKEVTGRHTQFSMVYKAHPLSRLGDLFSRLLVGVPDDQEICDSRPWAGQDRQRRVARAQRRWRSQPANVKCDIQDSTRASVAHDARNGKIFSVCGSQWMQM
jgi:hypothetical protein